jgi:hypothetical protein
VPPAGLLLDKPSQKVVDASVSIAPEPAMKNGGYPTGNAVWPNPMAGGGSAEAQRGPASAARGVVHAGRAGHSWHADHAKRALNSLG